MIAAPRLPTVGRNVVAVPRVVVDQRLHRLAVDRREPVVGVHRRRVVAPDDHLLDAAHGLLNPGRELRQRAIVVEAHHRGEVLLRQRRRGLHRDVGIGVRGVADDQHLDVPRRDGVERLALLDEDLRVLEQQVLALHSGPARLGADEQRDVRVTERDLRIAGAGHAGEQRKRAVLEFHHHAGQRRLRLVERQLEELQDHRLVAARAFRRTRSGRGGHSRSGRRRRSRRRGRVVSWARLQEVSWRTSGSRTNALTRCSIPGARSEDCPRVAGSGCDAAF